MDEEKYGQAQKRHSKVEGKLKGSETRGSSSAKRLKMWGK